MATPVTTTVVSNNKDSAGSDSDVEAEDEVLPIPDLRTRSVQDLLNSSDMSMDTISHHDGSGRMYMATKILKLQNLGNGHQVSSSIFKGCYLFVNGDTTPSRYEIQRLVSDQIRHETGGNLSEESSRCTYNRIFYA